MIIEARDINDARARLVRDLPLPTPLVRADAWSVPGRDVWLKNETGLPTASFKVRGALHALSRRCQAGRIAEVVAASTGNHGAAVAEAARRLGVSARIFVPVGSNPIKTARIRESGAVVIEAGDDLTAAIAAASDYVTATGAHFLHDASDRDIPAATATIGDEILEQCPEAGTVYVPMGDTALIRGVASALRLSGRPIRVVGVVAANAPAYLLSWKAGRVVETETATTTADGLAVRTPLAANVDAIRSLVDDVVMVAEEEMFDAVKRLHVEQSIIAEPSGAASVAALLRDDTRAGACVAVVTGGNLSPELRRRLVDAAMR